MKRSSKRKARASANSEARIADNPPQQPMDVTPARLDLNLYSSEAFDSPSPKSSISCRGRHRSARGHKQRLTLLKCLCLSEVTALGSPAVAPVDVIVPSLQVSNTSTAKSDVGVPSATNVNARVPSLQVMHTSTTESDEVILAAASVNVKVPALLVTNTSTATIDAGVPPPSSKKLIVSKTAYNKNMNKLPAQSLPVSPAVSSLTVAGPQSQGVSNEVVVKELPAQSMPVVSSVSSPRRSLTSTAAGPVPQRSTNKVAKAVEVSKDPFSDMRLNIDNMSYEELLALQDRIGYVSTGLSGKELVKARKVYTYRVKRRKTTKDAEVDSKCSICQEEYVGGDKLGNLKCKHRYHLSCIEHWLRQKNWCPTCKTDAAGS